MTELAEAPPIDAATASSGGRRLGTGTQTYLYVCLLVVAAIVIVPLLTTALGGFKTLGELRTNPFGLPETWEWRNYTDILFSSRYWQMLWNSLVISSLTVDQGPTGRRFMPRAMGRATRINKKTAHVKVTVSDNR